MGVAPRSHPIVLSPSHNRSNFFVNRPDRVGSTSSNFNADFIDESSPRVRRTLASLNRISTMLPILRNPCNRSNAIRNLLRVVNIPCIKYKIFTSTTYVSGRCAGIILNTTNVPATPNIAISTHGFATTSILTGVRSTNLACPLFVGPSHTNSDFNIAGIRGASSHRARRSHLTTTVTATNRRS